MTPAERGATVIADLVVAKIAAQAAQEALGTLPPEAAPPHATVVVLHHATDTGREGRARPVRRASASASNWATPATSAAGAVRCVAGSSSG